MLHTLGGMYCKKGNYCDVNMFANFARGPESQTLNNANSRHVKFSARTDSTV